MKTRMETTRRYLAAFAALCVFVCPKAARADVIPPAAELPQVLTLDDALRIFKARGLDPNEVKLIMPDVTFDSEMTIRLGGREAKLFYLGPGQQAGDTFILFPHARALFTPKRKRISSD